MQINKALKILNDPKTVDNEGMVTDEYWKAIETVQNELNIVDKEDLQEELCKLKRIIKNHKHFEGKVVVDV